MKQIIKLLQDENVGTVKSQESLTNHTTWKIGGPADIFVEPNGIDGLKKTMNIINDTGINWRVIGRGSNLLVADGGIEGVVIKLTKGFEQLEVQGEEIKVGGGYPLIKLATLISRQGLSGLEFAGGIPGSVGGAVFMNAGAHGSDISEILKEAHVLFADGTMEWIKAEDMDFSYRTSRLQKEDAICIEAIFTLKKGNKEEIVKHMQKNKDYRRESQPWAHPCCGSVFRNPLPHHAGKLIEDAGLKGYRIGGAQISEVHANFIVNVDKAKAKDVLDLIHYAKETVKEKYGVDMETEVEMIGRMV
ncbi:UDP-N-acetylmuramate dehydrogenase [Halalkalibacter urbisdiaboli]|uniref:UDP-N-acetylmuramate dehydrogenase n=1 Tax=Halalkalibacter urbisdiaboli TaxID=1960589 RepID=UPI000B440DDB|nr:UDP-N-acetylmuramate dehydrogenase [Halalkalibacter urbisdiaboli]